MYVPVGPNFSGRKRKTLFLSWRIIAVRV